MTITPCRGVRGRCFVQVEQSMRLGKRPHNKVCLLCCADVWDIDADIWDRHTQQADGNGHGACAYAPGTGRGNRHPVWNPRVPLASLIRNSKSFVTVCGTQSIRTVSVFVPLKSDLWLCLNSPGSIPKITNYNKCWYQSDFDNCDFWQNLELLVPKIIIN